MSLTVFGLKHRTIVTLGLGNSVLIDSRVYRSRPRINIIEKGVATFREDEPDLKIKDTSPDKDAKFKDTSPRIETKDKAAPEVKAE